MSVRGPFIMLMPAHKTDTLDCTNGRPTAFYKATRVFLVAEETDRNNWVVLRYVERSVGSYASRTCALK